MIKHATHRPRSTHKALSYGFFLLTAAAALMLLVVRREFLSWEEAVDSLANSLLTSQDPLQAIRIVPLDCTALSFDFHEGAFVNTSSTPSFAINIHSPKKDKYISASLARNGCFECDILQAAMQALQSRPDAVLIDVGSNIGIYSLTAASMGHKAFGFEPFRRNWERICRSVLRNQYEDMVTIYNKAATDKPAFLQLTTAAGNRGAMKVKEKLQENGDAATAGVREGVDFAQGVTLDSLPAFPVDKPVVLKIDVEGHECLALAGGMIQLSKLTIVYVAIEWSLERLTACRNRQAVFDLFLNNGLKPFMRLDDDWKPLDPNNWKDWKKRGEGNPRPVLYDVAWSKDMPNQVLASQELTL
jgi:FkbM family methyltransferase